MNLDLINGLFNEVKNSKFAKDFIYELQNYLEKMVSKNTNKEDNILKFFMHDEKLITIFRDKMLIERSNILNNYAKQTLENGEMYYIYDKNSNVPDCYNVCACDEEKSHLVFEINKENLPEGIEVGSVLRKIDENYILDELATKSIEEEIYNMEENILKMQNEYLENCRIEGHTYEISEINEDRVWLFDISDGNSEALEEIDFPLELLEEIKENDLVIYENGNYKIL